MSDIHVSNTADHSAAQQIRAHEQALHNFRGWCVNRHSILPFVVSSVMLQRRRDYAVVHDPIRRSSSVAFCYKARKFAFADTHHYAQAEISKTPLTQFMLTASSAGCRLGQRLRRWHTRHLTASGSTRKVLCGIQMKVAGTALLVLCTVRNSSEYAYNYCTITIHARSPQATVQRS